MKKKDIITKEILEQLNGEYLTLDELVFDGKIANILGEERNMLIKITASNDQTNSNLVYLIEILNELIESNLIMTRYREVGLNKTALEYRKTGLTLNKLK